MQFRSCATKAEGKLNLRQEIYSRFVTALERSRQRVIVRVAEWHSLILDLPANKKDRVNRGDSHMLHPAW